MDKELFNKHSTGELTDMVSLMKKMHDECQQFPKSSCMDHETHKEHCIQCGLVTMNSYLLYKMAHMQQQIDRLKGRCECSK